MRGIENELGLHRVAIICEVIMLLRNARPEDFEAIVQRLVVVLVWFNGRPEFFQDLQRALFVTGGRFPQLGHVHVRTHVHMHVGHLLVCRRSRLRNSLGVVLHFAHVHSRHIRFRRRILVLLRAESREKWDRKNCQQQNQPAILFHFSLSLSFTSLSSNPVIILSSKIFSLVLQPECAPFDAGNFWRSLGLKWWGCYGRVHASKEESVMFQGRVKKKRRMLLRSGLILVTLVLSLGSVGYSSTGASTSSASSQAPRGWGGTLQVDETPAGIVPSAQYTVRLSQGDSYIRSFVYQVQNPGFLPNGEPSGISSSSTLEHATSWTSFSFVGSITVQVTNTNPFSSARILPSHAQIIPTVNGNTVSFTLNQPGQFAVDFCPTGTTCSEANDTDLTNPMLVFANPMETEIPNPLAANVLRVTPGLSVPSGDAIPELSGFQDTLYFGPGIYDLGLTPLTIDSDHTVYLAAGAYVKGFLAFRTKARNATIRGRGILSGEDLPKAQCIGTTAGCPDMVGTKGNVQDLMVEGITFIQSPFYNVSINGGSGNTVDNVKVIAWLGNSDGIQASYGAQDTGSVIENSFVKNGDDSIKITASNLLVQNCVVWKLNNAAAFEIGAGIGTDVTNVTVRNSDVIRGEYN